jgi:hypothetical protein
MRQARVWDGTREDGRKYVSRELVPPDEIARVLDYLEKAPIVLAARGYENDEKDPSLGANVPMTFHTDGEWIWPGAVAYYLRTHEIPPEADFLAHIRGRGFELPEVDDHTRDAAVSVITGAPMPERPAPKPTPAEDQQRELAEQARQARETAALNRLKRRLGELGVDPEVYRVGEVADDTWCLVHEDEWSVFWSERGARHNEVGFRTADQAGAYLLGMLLIVPSRMRGPDRPDDPGPTPPAPADLGPAPDAPPAPADPAPPAPADVPPADLASPAPADPAPPSSSGPPAEPSASAGPSRPTHAEAPPAAQVPAPRAADTGPIEPLPGEPPLTLLRERRTIELPVGAVVDRFGAPNGNFTYAARTPYENRSLPPEWINSGYHVYRVQRPLRALSGVAVPWFGQPGGGIAYVLPRSVRSLLEDGTLIEIREP